jgi:hypothetical protein
MGLATPLLASPRGYISDWIVERTNAGTCAAIPNAGFAGTYDPYLLVKPRAVSSGRVDPAWTRERCPAQASLGRRFELRLPLCFDLRIKHPSILSFPQLESHLHEKDPTAMLAISCELFSTLPAFRFR